MTDKEAVLAILDLNNMHYSLKHEGNLLLFEIFNMNLPFKSRYFPNPFYSCKVLGEDSAWKLARDFLESRPIKYETNRKYFERSLSLEEKQNSYPSFVGYHRKILADIDLFLANFKVPSFGSLEELELKEAIDPSESKQEKTLRLRLQKKLARKVAVASKVGDSLDKSVS